MKNRYAIMKKKYAIMKNGYAIMKNNYAIMISNYAISKNNNADSILIDCSASLFQVPFVHSLYAFLDFNFVVPAQCMQF